MTRLLLDPDGSVLEIAPGEALLYSGLGTDVGKPPVFQACSG
jgi:hypothetical protein